MRDDIQLRDVEPADLPIFYEHQLDADAARMAGFPSRDRAAFDAHWATNVLRNPTAVNRTILAAFLHLVAERPLSAHVAKHNVGSIRVLEKCGFRVARNESLDELVLMLE
jgi:RimJ/RimL family protein N-acetyltransferase